MKLTKAAAVSFSSRFGRPQENLARMVGFVERPAEQGAHLVCFPELALQGYHTSIALMQEQAEPIDGPLCRQLIEAMGNCER